MMVEIDDDWGILKDVCPECAGIEGFHWEGCSNHNDERWEWEIETDQNFDFEVDF